MGIKPVVMCFLFLVLGQPIPALRITGDYISETIDVDGRVYAINSKLTLFKIGTAGDTLKTISLANHGMDPIIDASNPLELVVFFPSTGKVVWFDNQLNEQGSTDLYENDITGPVAFGRSNDGKIWVFDNNSKTLKKLSKKCLILQESVQIPFYHAGKLVTRIFDDGDLIVFNDGNNEVVVFDRNLVRQRANSIGKAIVGFNSGHVYCSDSGLLLQVDLSIDKFYRKDTLYFGKNREQIVATNGSSLLIADSMGLLLKRIDIRN